MNKEEELFELVLKSNFGVVIWWFPQYKWRMVALLSGVIANA